MKYDEKRTISALLEKNLLKNEILTEEELKHYKSKLAPGEALEKLLLTKEVITRKELEQIIGSIFSSKTLEEILIEEGVVSEEQMELIQATFKGNPSRIGEFLVKESLINDEQLTRARSIQFGIEFVDLSTFEIDDTLFREISLDMMQKYTFIPHKVDEGYLKIIYHDPTDIQTIDEIETVLEEEVRISLGTEQGIRKLLDLMVETSLDSQVVFGDVPELLEYESLAEQDAAAPEGLELHEDEEGPIIKLVDSVVTRAVRKKASDIHFEVYEDGLKVKYRIDGVLFEIMNIALQFRDLVISRLKIMSGLDIAESLKPQDGRFKMQVEGRSVDFRVSSLPSIFGETVVIRILDKTALGLDLTRLGFTEQDLVRFKKNIRKPYGMVLVAGPTGSGKTTTLYSGIEFVNTPGDKFITIEDPVEYQVKDVVQIAVNNKKGLTFADGLRSIVRQDPDKIMVGEIRDKETAFIAVNAALTGHLVLSSIHANNVIDAIGRLINMEIDVYEFVSSFNIIVAQRLVRRICSNCVVEYKDPDPSWNELMDDFKQYADGTFYRGEGCRYCHQTGYSGRTGIYEVLVFTGAIKQMILDRESPLVIKRKAIEEGMATLRQAGWQKVLSGVTTIQELNRVTFED